MVSRNESLKKIMNFQWTDRNRDLARLRIGPILAQIFQETNYLNIGLGSNEKVEHEVKVAISLESL